MLSRLEIKFFNLFFILIGKMIPILIITTYHNTRQHVTTSCKYRQHSNTLSNWHFALAL
nr:MAG TPA: hypothetical protein [Crassvirales sp.]